MSNVARKHYDAIVVGAGFAGMYLVHSLRKHGFTVHALEAGSDVGGTWYWNRYPGARCDVPSLEYSYKFDEDLQQEWSWPERFSAQPDILRYANHVADRFDLRKDITFNTQVTAAHYDEDRNRWEVSTKKGDTLTAQFCIMATGVLSSTNYPNIEGLDTFKGEKLHTGNWPKEEVDFSGKKVAVIGTGSSGIQAIPVIANQAEHLYVFQRTPQFSVPAGNTPMPRDEERNIKADYKAFRDRVYQYPGAVNQPENAKSLSEATPQEIEEELEKSWLKGGIGYLFTFSDLMESVEKNEVISKFAKKKMTEVIDDPKVLTKLMPDYPIGCKRIVLDNHYFQTYNRDDVTLVDIKDHPIDKITEHGLVTDGTEYKVDYIVFATGYDAMTGALTSIDIRGTKGISIKDKWKDNPIAFLGMTVSSFPNMFTVCGPGSPSVLANVITHIEQNSDWITDCMIYLRDSNQSRIEVNRESEKEWAMEVGKLGEQSLFAHCNSWYVGANIPGKARVFLAYTGGFPAYTERCDEIANSQYQGFSIS